MEKLAFPLDLVNECDMDEKYFDRIFTLFSDKLAELGSPLPSVSMIAEEDSAPYRVLVSTIISLRTKDAVTMEASRRLFQAAPDIDTLASMDAGRIAEIIKPAGFYRRKGEQLKRIAEMLRDEHGSSVPDDMDTLLSLPGDALCVDCHVHEISNRLGWVSAKSPEETEKELRKILPRRFWIPLNELLVRYGQIVCTPVSPRCSICPMDAECRKKGVSRTR